MSNMNPLGESPTSRTGAGATGGSETDYGSLRSHEGLDTMKSGNATEGRIRDKAAKVKEQVGQAADQAREKSAQVRQQVGEYTGNNPILSLALAFIAGVLLTAITRR